MLRCKRGFTLVEVIVVLTILAIVAAMLIPSLAGFIDEGRERATVADCHSCVSASEALLAKSYGSGLDTLALDTDKVKTMAAVDGTITSVLFGSSAQVEHLVYKNDICSVVYCSLGGAGCSCGNSEMYTINGSLGTTLSSSGGGNPGGAFVNALTGVEWNNSIDSTAPSGTNSRQQKVLNALGPGGLDIEQSNITSWAVRKEGTHTVIWFTDQDISKVPVGDKVRVIRYNTNGTTYTAGYMTVESHTEKGSDGVDHTYNVFVGGTGSKDWVEYNKGDRENPQTTTTKSSYSKTLEFFNEMSPTLIDQ